MDCRHVRLKLLVGLVVLRRSKVEPHAGAPRANYVAARSCDRVATVESENSGDQQDPHRDDAAHSRVAMDDVKHEEKLT